MTAAEAETGGGARRYGLLVMAYGTPASVDDIEAYYTHIRRGRPPTEAQLADLTARYEAIGGISPLAQRTEAQRVALAGALDRQCPGDWTVTLGQKHAAPYIEDGVAALAGAGADDVVGLVLAAHYSAGSVGEYHRRAAEAAGGAGVRYHRIDSWHLEPAYLDFLAGAVAEARATLPAKHKVLFTAHSLPERVLVDDPYADQLRQSAAAVADRVGLLPWPDWALAWQSAGRTPEPWRGPDILTVIRDLAETGRSEGVLVCPQGFTADHLEVLYDLDIEAAAVAGELGLAFARTRSLNDDRTVMAALAGLVLAAARTPSVP
jgi:ferrochelatase